MDCFDTGRVVEEMTAEGLRVIRAAHELYKPAAVVTAYSGGDDSVVTTHFAVANVPGCLVWNADTGIGLGLARRHISDTNSRFRWPLQVDRAGAEGPPQKMRAGGRLIPFDAKTLPAGQWVDGDTAYEEFCLNHGFPGRGKPQHARMYQRLKERPLRRLLKRLGMSRGGARALIVSGIRADESATRAGYRRETSVGYFGDVWVNPFYHRTAADFEAYRQEFGLPRNPVKRACGISGECACLTFPGPGEAAILKDADPDFGLYIDGLEARVRSNGFPWGWGESPPEWWKDARKGQRFLFDDLFTPPGFQPMCVGCSRAGR